MDENQINDEGKLSKVQAKHAKFVENYFLNGMNMTQAYFDTYNCTIETARKKSYQLMRTDEVKQMIKDKRVELLDKFDIRKEKIVKDLMDIIDMNMDKPQRHNTAIKAIEVLNKMLGFNEADKIDMTSNGETLKLRDLVVFSQPTSTLQQVNGTEINDLLMEKEKLQLRLNEKQKQLTNDNEFKIDLPF